MRVDVSRVGESVLVVWSATSTDPDGTRHHRSMSTLIPGELAEEIADALIEAASPVATDAVDAAVDQLLAGGDQ